MQKLSLDALARELLGKATGGTGPGAAGGSRAAQTVVGGHEKALRQTVIALAKDAALAEHASPGEATLYVLRGRVTLAAGADSWEAREGDLLLIPRRPAQPDRPGRLGRPAHRRQAGLTYVRSTVAPARANSGGTELRLSFSAWRSSRRSRR